MKTNACNLLWAIALGTATATASPLTPQEALTAAMAMSPQSVRMKAPGREMRLVLTVNSTDLDTPALYVFSKENSPGFLIAAADDAVTPLVGYSDSPFDPANVPPAMSEWLANCSEQVAEASRAISNRARVSTPQRNAIDPLVTTTWNQDYPYNTLCPEYNGQHCVTGCVATAMAQVMNYNRWPRTGVGSKTYTYVNQSGKASPLTLDFSSMTFDWDNMLDSYYGSSDDAQRQAVADLMLACGVVSEMKYSTTGSGANSFTAGRGMVTYLNYDRTMRYLERDWFDTPSWNDMVYSELASGRPVLYCGVTKGGAGHAFVCDGYSYDEYFHINWGWGGMCDGYFRLELLDPGQDQGIGGTTAGYAYHQSVLVGIQPNYGSPAAGCMVLNSNFETSTDVYKRSSSTPVVFLGGFYSYALSTTPIYIGIKCENKDMSTVVVYKTAATNLDSNYGLSKLSIAGTKFPIGEYDAYPVYRTSPAEDWQPLLYDRSSVDNTIHMIVSSSEIVIRDPEPEPERETVYTASFAGFSGTRDIVAEMYPEHTYSPVFSFDITGLDTDEEWSNDLYCLIYNEDGIIAGTDSGQSVEFTSDCSCTLSFDIKIPYLVKTGNYSIAMAIGGGNEFQFITEPYDVEIVYSAEDGYAQVSNIEMLGNMGLNDGSTYDSPVMIDNKSGGFVVRLYCPMGPWSDNSIFGEILDENDQIVSYTPTKSVYIDAEGVAEVTFMLGSEDGDSEYPSYAPARVHEKTIVLSSGTTYQFLPCSEVHGKLVNQPIYFQLMEQTVDPGTFTGVSLIGADADQATYYNLQGVRVDNPAAGQVYIMKKGSTSTKVKF